MNTRVAAPFTESISSRRQSNDTPPEVAELLDALTVGVREILGRELVGAYLFGSATTDDFDRESDVDVVVVTADGIADETFAALKAMHARIAAIDSWCATQLEVSYIPKRAIRRHDAADALHPRLDRGSGESLHMMRHGADWVVQRHLIRERGSALLGPPASTLIDAVSPDDMRQAMRELWQQWLAPLVEDPPHVRTRGYQSFIVLSVCRILYTLEHGDVLSKRAAASWGEETLDACWAALIRGAWTGRQNHAAAPLSKDLSETWRFIRYATSNFID
jgi:predicted nucleotidyltransferase